MKNNNMKRVNLFNIKVAKNRIMLMILKQMLVREQFSKNVVVKKEGCRAG